MGLIGLGEGRTALRRGALAHPLDPAEHRRRDCAPLARAQGIIGVAGVSLGYLGIVLPHPDYFNVPALLINQTVTGMLAVGLFLFASRARAWMLVLTPVLGTISAALGVIFSGDPVSAYALFFLWPAFYAFYFMSKPAALAHCILVVVFYAIAIAVTPSQGEATISGDVVHHYVIICGSLLVAAVLITLLRNRINTLVGQLTDAARSDLLTGLLNSRGVNESLAGELDRARMNAHRVSVLTVRLGGLRELQRRQGQRAGDELIKSFAELLKDSTRLMDHVARTGVAEYTVALPETDEGTAFLLAEQILGRARRTFREQQMPTAASIGVATFPKHAADSEALTQAAASAAEAAEALGGDRGVVFSAELEDVLAGDPARGLRDQRTHLSTVLSLAEVLDLRDARTASHSMAVARYAELIGEHLGLPDSRIQRLRLAGLLHDIGKVGIADSIFDKPGPLSPAEWDEVRRHPELAARILAARELADIREWILCRHEQPDGHGYPRGLRGDDIPLESRILAVAESYDAMTSDRPYRAAMTPDDAIAELGRYAGSQFDGAIVDAIVRVLAARPLETRRS
jgi:diguanylate cyclase (GGDEF)-like protein/putative nucleotidyltransferase with HDIG domain